jgi:hypothetical protein
LATRRPPTCASATLAKAFLLYCARFHNDEPLSGRVGSAEHVSQDVLIVGVDEEADGGIRRRDLSDQLEPLYRQGRRQGGDSGGVTAGTGKARDEPELHRVGGDVEDDGNRLHAAFGREGSDIAAGGYHRHLEAHKLVDNGRDPLVATLRPAVLDRHVLALDIPRIFQPRAETDHELPGIGG